MICEAQAEADDGRILYDAAATAYVDAHWFEPKCLAARGWLTGGAAGRGRVHFFHREGSGYVLRHYRRGGAMAAWLDDRYLWTGLKRTRAWREWRLLAKLMELRLPAPRPLAARVVKRGMFYRADLITVRILHTRSLAETLATRALAESDWREIGSVIARFHACGVWHADLNAHNILLDSTGTVTLIDFDRARFRSPAARWRHANLVRLLRSLTKLKKLNPVFRFSEADVESLDDGYASLRRTP